MDNKLAFDAFSPLMDIAGDVYWDNVRKGRGDHNEFYRIKSAQQTSRVLAMAGWTYDEYVQEFERRIARAD